jgi:hypothetical protein
MTTLVLTACAGGEPKSRTCEWPAEAYRQLDLTRSADRTHLRRDAESAETIAIHCADVSPARREGKREYDVALEECMESLFGAVARNHGLDIERVRAYTTLRNGLFDVMVLVLFSGIYAIAAYAIAGRIARQIGAEDWRVVALAVIGLSLGAAIVAMLGFDMWAITAENLRLGSWHLSYREDRLPWRRHGVLLFTGSVGVFGLISLLRVRSIARRLRDTARYSSPH